MKVDWPKVRKKAKDLFIEQWLLISYFVAALLALTWPVPGRAVAAPTLAGVHIVISCNIIIVFFISGLVLKTEDVKVAFKAPLGVVWGVVSCLFITPCLGFAFREIPLTPDAFTAGITLLCCVPMTLGIGISLVRSCGGNEGLALFLTVVTNLLGIFTMPLWLKALFSGSDFSLSFSVGTMVAKLVTTVMVPSVIGKLLRELSPRVVAFTQDHRTFLGMFSTFQLAFIVWQVLSGAQENVVNTPFSTIVYVVLLVSAQHIIYLAFNFVVTTYALRMPLLENVATFIMAAQKSGPVSVALITYLTPDVATQGIMSIPAVLGQLAQVFIGQLALVPVLSRRTRAHREKLRAEKESLPVVFGTAPPGSNASSDDSQEHSAQQGSNAEAEDTPVSAAVAGADAAVVPGKAAAGSSSGRAHPSPVPQRADSAASIGLPESSSTAALAAAQEQQSTQNLQDTHF